MPQVTLDNGLEVKYEDEGTGRPVVLLHGFCGSSRYWVNVIGPLSGGCRVIAPDLRGHGRSGHPEVPYRMESFADDLAGLLDRLDVEKACVFGHSLGGYVSLAFAERFGGRLQALGLVHSTSLPDTEEGKAKRLKGMEAIKETGIRPYVDGLIPNLFAPAHVETMRDAVDEAKRIGYETNAEGAIATLEGMRVRPDRTQVLSTIRMPVLLVAGEQDGVIPPEKTFAVEGAHIRQARIANAGHMSMYEAPGELMDILRDFLDNVQG